MLSWDFLSIFDIYSYVKTVVTIIPIDPCIYAVWILQIPTQTLRYFWRKRSFPMWTGRIHLTKPSIDHHQSLRRTQVQPFLWLRDLGNGFWPHHEYQNLGRKTSEILGDCHRRKRKKNRKHRHRGEGVRSGKKESFWQIHRHQTKGRYFCKGKCRRNRWKIPFPHRSFPKPNILQLKNYSYNTHGSHRIYQRRT